MYCLVVRFDVLDEDAAARFDELTAAVVHEIQEREHGTLLYATHTVADEPLARVFYEVYTDEAAFRAHNDADHVKDFHAAKAPLLTGQRVEMLTFGPTKGLPTG